MKAQNVAIAAVRVEDDSLRTRKVEHHKAQQQ